MPRCSTYVQYEDEPAIEKSVLGLHVTSSSNPLTWSSFCTGVLRRCAQRNMADLAESPAHILCVFIFVYVLSTRISRSIRDSPSDWIALLAPENSGCSRQHDGEVFKFSQIIDSISWLLMASRSSSNISQGPLHKAEKVFVQRIISSTCPKHSPDPCSCLAHPKAV